MKLKDMAHGAKCLVLGAMVAVGLVATAAEPEAVQPITLGVCGLSHALVRHGGRPAEGRSEKVKGKSEKVKSEFLKQTEAKQE